MTQVYKAETIYSPSSAAKLTGSFRKCWRFEARCRPGTRLLLVSGHQAQRQCPIYPCLGVVRIQLQALAVVGGGFGGAVDRQQQALEHGASIDPQVGRVAGIGTYFLELDEGVKLGMAVVDLRARPPAGQGRGVIS